MCISDANYKILYANIGHYGSSSDGGIFDRCDFKKKLDEGDLHLPNAEFVVGMENQLPFFFLGDAAFPFTTALMKPYPGQNIEKKRRIYNYRFYFN